MASAVYVGLCTKSAASSGSSASAHVQGALAPPIPSSSPAWRFSRSPGTQFAFYRLRHRRGHFYQRGNVYVVVVSVVVLPSFTQGAVIITSDPVELSAGTRGVGFFVFAVLDAYIHRMLAYIFLPRQNHAARGRASGVFAGAARPEQSPGSRFVRRSIMARICQLLR